MKRAPQLALGAALTAAVFSLTSCNIFDPIDGPGDDTAQLTSAARACFDAGDLDCAREYYNKISSPSDQVRAEMAFLRLDGQGASMGAFISALGKGDGTPGSIITSIANSMSLRSPGETTRLETYRAFNESDSITTNEQKGLVRFVSALAMVGAILGQDSQVVGNLKKTDLVSSATLNACLAANAGTCNAACSAPAGTVIGAGADPGGMDTTAETDFDSTPTWGMIRAALSEINPALTLMGATNQSTGDFATQILAIGTDNCLRWYLITNGVGN